MWLAFLRYVGRNPEEDPERRALLEQVEEVSWPDPGAPQEIFAALGALRARMRLSVKQYAGQIPAKDLAAFFRISIDLRKQGRTVAEGASLAPTQPRKPTWEEMVDAAHANDHRYAGTPQVGGAGLPDAPGVPADTAEVGESAASDQADDSAEIAPEDLEEPPVSEPAIAGKTDASDDDRARLDRLYARLAQIVERSPKPLEPPKLPPDPDAEARRREQEKIERLSARLKEINHLLRRPYPPQELAALLAERRELNEELARIQGRRRGNYLPGATPLQGR